MRTHATSPHPARGDASLGDLLRADHERLDALFEDLMSAFAADARDDLRRLWSELDRSLTDHMRLEERRVLPVFAEVDAAEAAALRAEHDDLRRALLELGVCVDLHSLREEVGARFIARLRDHARREDALLYRWADAHEFRVTDAGARLHHDEEQR